MTCDVRERLNLIEVGVNSFVIRGDNYVLRRESNQGCP